MVSFLVKPKMLKLNCVRLLSLPVCRLPLSVRLLPKRPFCCQSPSIFFQMLQSRTTILKKSRPPLCLFPMIAKLAAIHFNSMIVHPLIYKMKVQNTITATQLNKPAITTFSSSSSSKLGVGLSCPSSIFHRNRIETQSRFSGYRIGLLSDYAGKIDQNSQPTPSEYCSNSLRF